MRMSASLTETRVLTSERKRTSLGTTGVAASRVVHQMFVGCPGTSVASMAVCPFSEDLEVMRPRLIRTLVWSPGTTSASRTLPADGTGRLKEARPASMLKGRSASSVTAKSAGPTRTAVWVPFSSARGKPFPSWRASRIAMPVVRGILVAPL